MPTRPKTHRPQGPRKSWVKRLDAVSRVRGRALQTRNARILHRDPLCKECLRTGRVSESKEVDHVIPLEQGGSDHDFNLEGICIDHHRDKTKAESIGGRMREGRAR